MDRAWTRFQALSNTAASPYVLSKVVGCASDWPDKMRLQASLDEVSMAYRTLLFLL